MTAHSPTPWKIVGGTRSRPGFLIDDAKRNPVGAAAVYEGAHPVANAERIVACVNACAELPDPDKLAALIARCRDERSPGLTIAALILTELGVLS